MLVLGAKGQWVPKGPGPKGQGVPKGPSPQGVMGPQGPGSSRANGSSRAPVPKAQWVPKAQASSRPRGPHGPRVPRAHPGIPREHPRDEKPKKKLSRLLGLDKILMFLKPFVEPMGLHGDPWGLYGGFFVEQWCYHKAPREPHGLQEGLMPPRTGHQFFLGLGVWIKSSMSQDCFFFTVLDPFWQV